MKMTQKFISYVLVFFMVFSSFTVLPSEFWGWANVSATDLTTEKSTANTEGTLTEGDFTYSLINNEEVEIVDYIGVSATVVIPNVTSGFYDEELTDKKVTSIADGVFSEMSITSVTIGENIKSIGSNAFYKNEMLTTVDFSKSKNLSTIGAYAFCDNNSLEEVTLPKGVETIGDKAFYNCNGIKNIAIGNGIKSIGCNAFASCEALETVKIGSGSTTIETTAFAENPSLSSVTVSADNSGCTSSNGVLYNKAKTAIITYPQAKVGTYTVPNTITEITDNCFKECKELTEIVIGNSVKTIGNSAFEGCSALYKVTLGKNVTAIGDKAFYQSYALEEINLDNCPALTTIGDSAFYQNKALTELNLSECTALTTIGDSAFYQNTFLTKVNLSNCTALTTVGNSAFYGCSRLLEADMSNCTALKTLGDYAFAQSAEFTKVSFSKCTNFETIGNSAFSGNGDLEEIDLSECESLTTVGDYAFYKNSTLMEIDFSASKKLTKIGEYAFYDNSRLAKVILPTGTTLKTIDKFAFCGANSLENINLSECKGLKTIGDSAFIYNYALSQPLSLESIETIGEQAFANCKFLSDIEIGNKLKEIKTRAFYKAGYISKVNIKGGNDAVIRQEAFASAGVKNLYIGNGVKVIENSAFSDCKLCKIDIGDTVKTIGDKAIQFYDESEITLGKSVENMGVHAIYGNYQYSATVKILSNRLSNINYSFPNENITIYCYKNSATHKTLVRNEYGHMLKFFNTNTAPTDIQVNGFSVGNFNAGTKEYTVYVNDVTNVKIEPLFESNNVSYVVIGENDTYQIKVYDENKVYKDTYTVNVKLRYTVIGDVTLMLNNISATKVGGNIALPAGTYKLKIAKGSTELGYNKTVENYSGGLTVNEKYSAYITLKATGGTYSFQFDTKTNKLVIKYDKNLPNEYLIGDIDTILKPVGDRPLSIGTQQLPAGTYKFKVSIGGTEYGYNKIVDDATTGSLSVNSKYSTQITLNATGGMYTFTLNTETNKLIIRHTPTANECATDVHISGTFNLVLDDSSATGEDSTVATGTQYLEEGCYTFKVYNYGVAYTAGAILNDNGERTLSSKYTTPITLNVTGGTYKFIFDKETGLFEVILLEE